MLKKRLPKGSQIDFDRVQKHDFFGPQDHPEERENFLTHFSKSHSVLMVWGRKKISSQRAVWDETKTGNPKYSASTYFPTLPGRFRGHHFFDDFDDFFDIDQKQVILKKVLGALKNHLELFRTWK